MFSPHALNRCFDRHGFLPTVEQERAAWLDIVEGRALLTHRMPNGREHLRVNIGAVMVAVVYAPILAMVLTVLPPERVTSVPHQLDRMQRRRNQNTTGRVRRERVREEEWQ